MLYKELNSLIASFSIKMHGVLCFFFVLIYSGYCLQENYYWKEYTGTVPEDAVVVGNDINGKNVHVGQAYVKNEGLIVVQIYPGTREVYAPSHGIKKVNTYIKILCGPQNNFYWMPATAKTLHLQLLEKHAVIGGHEDGFGQMNVGRISHQGEVKIGKINAFSVENAGFYFNDGGTERSLQSYEILMFNRNVTFDVRNKVQVV